MSFKPLRSYKTLLFDLDDTLIDFAACEKQTIFTTLKHVGINVNNSQVWERFLNIYEPINTHYWQNRAHLQLSGFELIEKSFSDTFSQLGYQEISLPPLVEYYWHTFNTLGIPIAGAVEVLCKLDSLMPLGLITNGYKETQHLRLQAAGLTQYFDVIVVSEEVGCYKPDPKIFKIALQALAVSPAEALYIGDSLFHDGQGASASEIDFCWYNPKHKPNDSTVVPSLMIRDLAELLLDWGFSEE